MLFCFVWHFFEKKDAVVDFGMKDKSGTGFQDTIPCSHYQVTYSKTSPSSETLYWNIPGTYSETTQTVEKIFPNGIHLAWINDISCVQLLQTISLK